MLSVLFLDGRDLIWNLVLNSTTTADLPFVFVKDIRRSLILIASFLVLFIFLVSCTVAASQARYYKRLEKIARIVLLGVQVFVLDGFRGRILRLNRCDKVLVKRSFLLRLFVTIVDFHADFFLDPIRHLREPTFVVWESINRIWIV